MVAADVFDVFFVEYVVHAQAQAVFVFDVYACVHVGNGKAFGGFAFVYAQTACHIKITARLFGDKACCRADVVAAVGKVVFVVGLDGGFKRTDLIGRPAVGFVVSVVVGGFDACRLMRIEVVTRVGLRGKQSCVHVACDDAAVFGSCAALSVCAVKNNQVFDFVRHKRAAHVPARACERVHVAVVVVVAAVGGEPDAVVFFSFQQGDCLQWRRLDFGSSACRSYGFARWQQAS